MKMKRLASLFLAALLALPLAGCGMGAGSGAAMEIFPAQLTAEEEKLAELLEVELDSYRVFDFHIGSGSKKAVQTIQLAIYELVDGEWKASFLGQEAFLDADGRLALSFGKLTEGVRVAVQSEGGSTARSFTIRPEEDAADMVAYLTTVLSETTEMEFDKEVPLVVQIATSKSEINSTDVNGFYTPAQYIKYGYEHVYAITVMFSQKTVAELERDAQAADQ